MEGGGGMKKSQKKTSRKYIYICEGEFLNESL